MTTLGMLSLGILLAVWLGYPAVIRLIAWLMPVREAASEAGARSVSVILATRATAAAVRERVADLLRTTYRADLLEIVVAVDGDGCDDVVRALAGIPARIAVVAADAPGGKAAALNAAVRRATGEILVFTDTAQRFEPGAIGALVQELAAPRVGAVSGLLRLPAGDRAGSLAAAYWRFERWLRFWEARVHSCVGVTGAIYAMPRSLWAPLPADLLLDDVYTPMRLALQGFRIAFTDLAVADDPRLFEVGDEFRRKVRTLTGVVQVCAWLPGVLNPVRNPLWLQFIFHKVLRLLTPFLMVFAIVGLAGGALLHVAGTPSGPTWIAGVMVAGALVLAVRPARRALTMHLRWGLVLPGSAALATWNALRGRWDVWK